MVNCAQHTCDSGTKDRNINIINNYFGLSDDELCCYFYRPIVEQQVIYNDIGSIPRVLN